MSAAISRAQDVGKSHIPLHIKLNDLRRDQKSQTLNPVADGLRELYRKGEFTDVSLICADRSFRAHRCVLAARSDVFFQGLASNAPEPKTSMEVRLVEVTNPEAVKLMLDHIYQIEDEEYNPKSQEINKDVLKLAQNFKLHGLQELATRYLSQELSTGNVVERLTICEDFALEELKEKILEQLTFNKQALAEVASCPQIIAYPKLMQSLLKMAAAVPNEQPEPPSTPAEPRRKLRKAGA